MTEEADVDPKQLWQWLSETEDELEKAVNKYNDLLEVKERLDRREFVREILIRGLRNEIRLKDKQAESAQDIANALEIKLQHQRIDQRLANKEIESLRGSHDEAQRQLIARLLLLNHGRRDAYWLTSRNKQLVQMVKDLEQKIKESTAAKQELSTQTSSNAPNQVAETMDAKVEAASNDLPSLQSQIESELRAQNDEYSKFVNEQHTALLEWEAAYKSLEEELAATKAQLVNATKQATSPALPQSSAAVPKRANMSVQPERTNGCESRQQSLSSDQESSKSEDSKATKDDDSTSTTKTSTSVGGILNSVLKIVSKM